MDHKTARKVKWDLVDALLCMVHEEPTPLTQDYNEEERLYAIEQVERFARMLNVKDHVYL
jgi:hypothetical protein